MKLLETTPLVYDKHDLEPVMSEKTIDYHYEHLAKNYAINYNAGKGNPRFNKAGNFLHNVFFAQFKKAKSKNAPTGKILQFINKHYKSYDAFKEAIKNDAMKIEGSGWIYLSTDGTIKIIHNHAIRHDILLLIDWWEHAWALDYKSNKGAYLDNIWSIIAWDFVNNKINDNYNDIITRNI